MWEGGGAEIGVKSETLGKIDRGTCVKIFISANRLWRTEEDYNVYKKKTLRLYIIYIYYTMYIFVFRARIPMCTLKENRYRYGMIR